MLNLIHPANVLCGALELAVVPVQEELTGPGLKAETEDADGEWHFVSVTHLSEGPAKLLTSGSLLA
jgi:hypothetical protein